MSDIILLSTADWDQNLWTNKQHVALALSRLGHRVLYVESLGLRAIRRDDLTDRLRILKRLKRCLMPPRQKSPGLWVWSPLALPGTQGAILTAFNRYLFHLGLYIARNLISLRNDWLWTYNPKAAAYLKLSSYKTVIYHCVDDIQAQPGMNAEDLDRWESELCRSASVVFVTSPALLQSRSMLNKRTYFFPNVADHKHFKTALLPSTKLPNELFHIPQPRIGFIGAISAYKLDLTLLEKAVAQLPGFSFVFIGPVGEGDPDTDIAQLESYSNVFFVGLKPYSSIPNWLAGVDVAILPLQRNTYTHSMFPMKFFEYLSAGRPVVSTHITSLEPYSDIASLTDHKADHFCAAIKAEYYNDCVEKRQARSDYASSYTYEKRTKAMLDLI